MRNEIKCLISTSLKSTIKSYSLTISTCLEAHFSAPANVSLSPAFNSEDSSFSHFLFHFVFEALLLSSTTSVDGRNETNTTSFGGIRRMKPFSLPACDFCSKCEARSAQPARTIKRFSFFSFVDENLFSRGQAQPFR